MLSSYPLWMILFNYKCARIFKTSYPLCILHLSNIVMNNENNTNERQRESCWVLFVLDVSKTFGPIRRKHTDKTLLSRKSAKSDTYGLRTKSNMSKIWVWATNKLVYRKRADGDQRLSENGSKHYLLLALLLISLIWHFFFSSLCCTPLNSYK